MKAIKKTSMPAPKPTVSVIIPTYNRQHFLDRAIQSVLAQTYRDLELIVVDDGSSDETASVAQFIKDNRLKYLRHEQNRGASAARNTGIKAAKGQFIAFLDSDDEWLPEKLMEQVMYFEEQPHDVGAIDTYHLLIYEETNRQVLVSQRKENRLFDQLIRIDSSPIGTPSTVILRRTCLDDCGLFDETLPAFNDKDMWIRVASKYKFKTFPKILVKKYMHAGGIQYDITKKLKAYKILLEKYYPFIESRGDVHSRYHFVIGLALCHTNKIDAARRQFRTAIRLHPFGLKIYLYFVASLFGQRVYLLLYDLTNHLKHPFAKSHRCRGRVTT